MIKFSNNIMLTHFALTLFKQKQQKIDQVRMLPKFTHKILFLLHFTLKPFDIKIRR